MSDEIEETPNTIGEAERKALDGLKAASAARESQRNAAVIRKMTEALTQASQRDAAEIERSNEIASAAAPAPKVPALSAVRTNLASMSNARYRALPKWQQEIRTPDLDYLCARYFRALSTRNSQELALIADEDRHLRASLTEGVPGGTDGEFQGTAGETLPLPLANYINAAVYRMARFRSLVRVFPSTSGASIRIPLQSAVSTSTWKAELAPLTQGEGAIEQHLQLVLQKLTNLAIFSNELLEDSAFAVATWLVEDVSMSMAETEDKAVYSDGAGSGSEEPRGFEAADTTLSGGVADPAYYHKLAAQAADNVTAGPIGYDDLAAMFYMLPEKERANAVWTCSDQVALYLSLLVDKQGRPILREQNAPGGIVGDAAASGQTGTILGRPVYNLPGKSSGTVANGEQDTNRLYFMNPTRSYAMLEKSAIRVESSRDAGFNTDSTHYRFVRRLDGGVIGNTIASRWQYVYTGTIDGAKLPA